MGKDSKPAPAPDPLIGQAAQGNIELGREQLAFIKEQYAEGKIRQADLDALTARVAESALDSQTKANTWAQEDRDKSNAAFDKYTKQGDEDRQLGRDAMGDIKKISDAADASSKEYESIYNGQAKDQSALGKNQIGRYNSTFAPVEDRVASDAMGWDSAGRQETIAGEAKADAMDAGSRAREMASRSMASMGVNPNSGRFAAGDQANATAVALASAGAQNNARNQVRREGVQLRQQAAQLGQQVLGSGQQANALSMQATQAAQQARMTGFNTALAAKNQSLAAAGIGNTSASLGLSNQGAGYTGIGSGLQAGGSAIGATQAGTQGWANNNGMMSGGFSNAIGANASGAGIAGNLYGQQLNAWNAQNQANAAGTSGILGGVTALGSLGLKAYGMGMFG